MTAPQKTDHGLSLCMIVRDEEHSIEAVLSSARAHVEEIVVVDTGSKDQTVAIAKRYADRLEHFDWIDDFSAARNYSLELASQPWILVLDADEVIADDDYSRLRELTLSASDDGFYLIQRLYQNNPDSEQALWKPADSKSPLSKNYRGYTENPILRLFKNSSSIRYSGRIHEIVDRSIGSERRAMSDIAIHHYHEKTENETERHVLRNLSIQEAMISDGTATAREFLSAGAAHLRTTKKYDKAGEYLLKALELGARADAALEALAETYYRNGQLQRAKTIYQQLHESHQGSTAVLNNLANLRIRDGDLAGGVNLLEALLEKGIEDPSREERVRQNIVAVRKSIEQGSNPTK